MKKLIQYFKKRREQRLRKWCIEKACHDQINVIQLAKDMLAFIKMQD